MTKRAIGMIAATMVAVGSGTAALADNLPATAPAAPAAIASGLCAADAAALSAIPQAAACGVMPTAADRTDRIQLAQTDTRGPAAGAAVKKVPIPVKPIIQGAKKCIKWTWKNVCVPVMVTVMGQECYDKLQPAPPPPPPPPPPPSTTAAPKPPPPPAKPIMIKVKVCEKVAKQIQQMQCKQQQECQEWGP